MPTNAKTKELYVAKLEILKDLRCFQKGFAVDFSFPLTILIGENGSGKSTLLDLIRTEYKPKNENDLWSPLHLGGYASIIGKKPAPEQIRYFDFHSSDMKYATVFGDNMSSQIQAQRLSSGMAVTIQLGATGMLKAENSLLLIDEAARGYSPNMQWQFAKGIYLSTFMHNNQVILSTHSEHIMDLSELEGCRLYSVEHKKYMTKNEFLKSHLKEFK